MPYRNQPTAAPTTKVTAAGAMGALSTVGVWAAQEFASIEIPGEVASAIVLVVMFVAAYVIPERE